MKTNKPSFMLKSYNYFKAVSKRVLGGFENVEPQVYYDRVYICSRCPELLENKECNVCGCPVETKAAWQTENCPKEKW